MDAQPHFSQAVQPQDAHYVQNAHQVPLPQPQQLVQQQQPWSHGTGHLIPVPHNTSPYQSPATSSSQLDHSFSGFFHGQSAQSTLGDTANLERSSSLSLNISSLSVTSPTDASPITPSPIPSTASTTISPITPLTPSSASRMTPQQALYSSQNHAQQHRSSSQMFAFVPADQNNVHYEHSQYDIQMHRSSTSSRSSSASDKSIPRKRSFTGGAHPLPVSMEESIFETNAELTPSYEDLDLSYPVDSHGSPVDGNSSGDGEDDQFKAISSQNASEINQIAASGGKSGATNNFVTKLYQMISDPKSSSFITWNEHGSSFVVSNVGEFSRTILGSHFKHSNFSSFVRQLNMYGFHKINRGRQTPRAQRTSTETQTWEFSHPRFLRDRPDLLDEIKRKALDPDPNIKSRVELPGEIASQLNQMRETNKKLVKALDLERAKVDRLTRVTKSMHELLSKAYPGALPAFPPELWEASDNPPIFVTSPSSTMQMSSRYPPLPSSAFHGLQSFSPSSSPTASDFPPQSHGHQHQHPLSRTHSLQHIPYDYSQGGASMQRQQHYETMMSGGNAHLPSPNSAVDQFHAGEFPATSSADRKRQRTGNAAYSSSGDGSQVQSKRVSRARSDSAPLGHGFGQAWPNASRPRSGSSLVAGARANGGSTGRRDDVLVNISGSAQRSTSSATVATTAPQPPHPPLLNVQSVIKSIDEQ